MKKVLVIISVVILVALGIGASYYFVNGKIYKLNLPPLDNLQSISLHQNENEKVIDNSEEMNKVLYTISDIKSKNKKESIQDSPVNVDNEIRIDFNFIGRGTSTIFVYKKNNKYYIERSYNGIYKISNDEYNSIERLVK